MTDTPKFTSPKIADAMAKVFGDDVKKVKVDMKFRKEVGKFVLKVDRVHKEAKNSKQIFK